MNSRKKHINSILKSGFALMVGFINGFFGGGGGLLCVPVLERVYHLKEKNAHATAIAVMLPLSVSSTVVYMIKNFLNERLAVSVVFGVLIGGFIGAIALKKVKGIFVRWLFIVILFVAGVRMMV